MTTTETNEKRQTVLGRIALAAVPAVPPATRSDLAEVDAALDAALPSRKRNANGEFACERCGGEGSVDVVYGHPNDPNAPGGYEQCPSCYGRGAEECVGCGEAARIEGMDPDYLYCGVQCATADGNAPAGEV